MTHHNIFTWILQHFGLKNGTSTKALMSDGAQPSQRIQFNSHICPSYWCGLRFVNSLSTPNAMVLWSTDYHTGQGYIWRHWRDSNHIELSKKWNTKTIYANELLVHPFWSCFVLATVKLSNIYSASSTYIRTEISSLLIFKHCRIHTMVVHWNIMIIEDPWGRNWATWMATL